MRILVVGAGSVGGYFGGRLAAAGRDVTFLVRAARAEQLRRDGLRIVSEYGDLTLAPKIVVKEEIAGPYDVIIFAVKAFGFEAAMEDFAAAVGPETMILPLLNGMRHIDVLVARFGEKAVLGGTTRISTDLDSEGRIHQMGPLVDVTYGERDGAMTERVKALDAAMSGANFEARLSDDVLGAMWLKWVVLASLASTTCLLRGSIGAIASVAGGAETESAILDESAAIVSAAWKPVPVKPLENMRERLTDKASSLTASMYRDVQKHAPVEVEHIIGDLLRRGAEHGVATPLLRAAYVQLAVYEAQRVAERA